MSMAMTLENQVEALKARRRLSQLISTLVQDERWIALAEEIKKAQRAAFLNLMNSTLDLPQIRWWQGYYTALSVISHTKSANQSELDQIDKALEELDFNQEMRQMLAEGELPDSIKSELLKASGLL